MATPNDSQSEKTTALGPPDPDSGQNSSFEQITWPTSLSSLAIGASVGWLIGLSSSPVVGSVVAVMMSIGFGAVVAFSGFKTTNISLGSLALKATLVYIAFFSMALASVGTAALITRKWMTLWQIEKEAETWARVFDAHVLTSVKDGTVAGMLFLDYIGSKKNMDTVHNNLSGAQIRDIGFFKADSTSSFVRLRDEASSIIENNGKPDGHVTNPMLIALCSDSSFTEEEKMTVLNSLSKIK